MHLGTWNWAGLGHGMEVESFDVILMSPKSGFGAKTHRRKGEKEVAEP